MEFNDFVPIASSNYMRLLDGTPYGLVVNRDRELVGAFVVLYGLEAFRQHCYIPDKDNWLSLRLIEHRKQEIVGESGRWEDNPWQLLILSLTKEQLDAVREEIANSKDFKFVMDDENVKTYISEEE